MDWGQLLNKTRLGRESESIEEHQARTAFQRDYDRILFSDPFRGMQNKTQVLPLPKADFVHTRLTHSLETSAVGRSLGAGVGHTLVQRHGLPAENGASEMGHLVGAACLAHDIGNPPFGHFGEDAIAEFFRLQHAEGRLRTLNPAQWEDLRAYEGNAAGWRLLVHQSPETSRRQGGLQLTYALLSVFAKYPKPSLPNLKPHGRASQKKFGYFQAERSAFACCAEGCGLSVARATPYGDVYRRHPLSFLVEAADDICYHIIDLEDAFKLGWVAWEQASELLLAFDPNAREAPSYRLLDDPVDRIGYLRARAINRLVQQAEAAFLDLETELLAGHSDQPLVERLSSAPAMEALKKFSVTEIYRFPSVLELELAGYRILHGLLDVYWQALHAPDKLYHRKVLDTLPAAFQHLPRLHTYGRALGLATFVGGLSDRYAIHLHQKLKGSVPGEAQMG
jgi:dGTPase